jgi:predicted acyl esterase
VPDFFLEAQRHPLYDDFWRERAAAEKLDQIQVPVLRTWKFPATAN